MSLTLRTNRWASRIIIILHLVIWNAVGIILLQKGVGILRKRMLETGHIIETSSSINLSIESTIASIKHTENEYDLAIASAQQQFNQNEKIIIRVNSESSLRNDRNYPVLNVIRNEFETASKEQQRSALFLSNSFENSTIDGQKLRIGNHLTEINHINHPENKSASTTKILRIVRDREHTLNKILKNIHAEENVTRLGSVSESKEEGNRDAKRKDLNSMENKPKFFIIGTDSQATNNSLQKSNDRIKFSNKGGAATAITMVAIGAIMLLVGPVVIILRILDERKQARKLHALGAAREDLPPTYEQAVFSSEAPRYSSLALNDDNYLLPSTPPPSPTLVFSNLVIKPHST
ncbi:hypothetical protein ACFW04_010292 [Cataglyphis niger]